MKRMKEILWNDSEIDIDFRGSTQVLCKIRVLVFWQILAPGLSMVTEQVCDQISEQVYEDGLK